MLPGEPQYWGAEGKMHERADAIRLRNRRRSRCQEKEGGAREGVFASGGPRGTDSEAHGARSAEAGSVSARGRFGAGVQGATGAEKL